MNKKLKNLTQINGKIKDKKDKINKIHCPHNSFTKVEEGDERYYECRECGHTWS